MLRDVSSAQCAAAFSAREHRPPPSSQPRHARSRSKGPSEPPSVPAAAPAFKKTAPVNHADLRRAARQNARAPREEILREEKGPVPRSASLVPSLVQGRELSRCRDTRAQWRKEASITKRNPEHAAVVQHQLLIVGFERLSLQSIWPSITGCKKLVVPGGRAPSRLSRTSRPKRINFRVPSRWMTVAVCPARL